MAWRRSARRAEDVARLWSRAEPTTAHSDQHAQALQAHRAAIKTSRDTLPPGGPEALKDALDRWADDFRKADGARSAQWLRSLVGLADKKAVKLESEAKHKRTQEWRTAVGAVTIAGSKTPTRLAYRWIKGLTGWSKSPTGSDAANDAVRDEPSNDDDDHNDYHEATEPTSGDIKRASDV